MDLELRHGLWDFLRRINRDGTTIFLTTHYIEEAEKLCSRIGVIHEGKMMAVDKTESLIRKMAVDRVELHLKSVLSEIPEALRPMEATLTDSGRKVLFEEREGAVSRVLKYLYEQKIEVERIDVRRPTLEDAFLKLTKGNRHANPLGQGRGSTD